MFNLSTNSVIPAHSTTQKCSERDLWQLEQNRGDIEREDCGYSVAVSATIRLSRENNCHDTSIDVTQLK